MAAASVVDSEVLSPQACGGFVRGGTFGKLP